MDAESNRTTTSDALLGMLSLRPMSGYDLKLQIESSIGNFWSESFGQIYPALKRLEQDGLITVASEASSGRKVYSLNDAGREHLERWLEVPPRPRVPRHELLLKLFFGSLAPAETLCRHVFETRNRYAADLLKYEAYGNLLPLKFAGNPGLPYWLATLSYGRAEARMILAWCDETLANLAPPSAGPETQYSEPLLHPDLQPA